MKNELTGEDIGDADLASLATLASNQVDLELQIEIAEADLATKKDSLKRLSEEIIPSHMEQLGLSSFTLGNGYKLLVKPYYACKIPEDRSQEAFAWLRAGNYSDIIKNTVSLQFGKGEDDLAIQVAEKLVGLGLSPEQKIFVHPQTLKSFVRECIENGKELPTDLFGVYVGKQTKITPPKAK
jgi:hypothetical protein